VSDVGAGDSFLAVIALALASGASAHQAARIAIEASCVAAGKRRTSTVSLRELLQRISLQVHAAESRGGERELGPLIAALDAARAAGQTVVFTNGSFDLLHAGRIEFLRQARQLGDLLVVGVNSNRTTRLLKGDNRPLNDEQSRLALVRALGPVSHALLFDDEEPSAIIRALQPDIHVKGGDYAGVELPEAEAVAEVGGRIVILPLAGADDARQLVERIALLTGDEIGAEL
jgi:D-beta-D-heptose 7-phosphate kinase/D-beta-D-heptose 1-phosphate adenosyltransferase